jgi:hypothetical protein
VENDSLLHGNVLLVVETSFALHLKNKVLGPAPNTGKRKWNLQRNTVAARQPRQHEIQEEQPGLDLLAEKNVQIGKTSNRDQETWPWETRSKSQELNSRLQGLTRRMKTGSCCWTKSRPRKIDQQNLECEQEN